MPTSQTIFKHVEIDVFELILILIVVAAIGISNG